MPKGLDRFASRRQGFRHEEGQHAQHLLVAYREKAGEEFGGADRALFERDQEAFRLLEPKQARTASRSSSKAAVALLPSMEAAIALLWFALWFSGRTSHRPSRAITLAARSRMAICGDFRSSTRTAFCRCRSI